MSDNSTTSPTPAETSTTTPWQVTRTDTDDSFVVVSQHRHKVIADAIALYYDAAAVITAGFATPSYHFDVRRTPVG